MKTGYLTPHSAAWAIICVIFVSPISIFAQNLLVAFKPGVSPAQIRRIIDPARHLPEIDVYLADSKLFTALQRNPNVEFVEIDRKIAPAQTMPNDPLFPSANSWAWSKISAPQGWELFTGVPIVIAILDTGVDPAHPDLAGKLVAGWNVWANTPDTSDVSTHGTFVAAVAAANSNNSIANASVCWGCLVMPVRISNNQGLATYSTMAEGISWAMDHGAQIVNLSYHASGSKTVSRAAKRFYTAGGLTIVAAGNDGAQLTIPADPYIIAVGATAADDTLASYSNRGPYIDLVAPGFLITVCTPYMPGFACTSNGTSISAPLVAATAALIKGQHPSWSAAEIETHLRIATDDLGPPGYDAMFGSGRLNLFNAVQ